MTSFLCIRRDLADDKLERSVVQVSRRIGLLFAAGLAYSGCFTGGAMASGTDLEGPAPYVEAVLLHRGEKPEGYAEKIIGGEPAAWEEHKWQAALLVSWIADPVEARYCGGAIVAPYWVVTAAHCVVEGRSKPEATVLSTDDINVLTGSAVLAAGDGRRANVHEIIVHPDYDPATIDNDIALLRLRTEAVGESIPTATLETETALLSPGTEITVTGWGVTESAQRTSALREVAVPIVSRRKCNGPASYDGRITANMICAGLDQGGMDSCQGDSGGPAVKDETLIGIVSWGDGCAEAFKYGVYARTAVFHGWIQEAISRK